LPNSADQILTVLEILKCFSGYASITYAEDGVFITHHESVWQDLAEEDDSEEGEEGEEE
jgi:hypothetical protein